MPIRLNHIFVYHFYYFDRLSRSNSQLFIHSVTNHSNIDTSVIKHWLVDITRVTASIVMVRSQHIY